MVTTGDILTKYLNKWNITQTTIANILGVSPQYINALINNRKKPSKIVMNNLVKVLNISKEDIQIIEKYEVYKKVKYTEDYPTDIQCIGVYTLNGFEYKFSEEKISISNLKRNDLKYLKIEIDNLEEFKLGEYIFIETKDLYIESIDKDFILINFDGSIDFVYVEHVNDKLYMRYLNHLKGTNILSRTNQSKIKIIGKYIGKYMGRILNG